MQRETGTTVHLPQVHVSLSAYGTYTDRQLLPYEAQEKFAQTCTAPLCRDVWTVCLLFSVTGERGC